MSFRSRVAKIAGILALLSGSMAVPLMSATPASATGITMSILQFNMCGNACGKGLTVAHDVESSVNSHSPQPSVITLEEVCRGQYNDIYGSLTPYYGHFAVTKAGGCSNGEDYGIAILVRTGSYTYLGDWKLPESSSGSEDRRLACLSTNAFGGSQPLVACVTHITTVSADIPSQISTVASKVRGYYNGNHVLLGGDFNTKPGTSAMNPLYNNSYSPAGSGFMAEADLPYQGNRNSGSDGSSTNEYTSCGGQHTGCGGSNLYSANAKIDYIFLGNGDWSNYSADSTSAPHSDHKPLWATATLS
jgi:endonuclease/exonuclease/phosphatase family metal-dependent hydrolase